MEIASSPGIGQPRVPSKKKGPYLVTPARREAGRRNVRKAMLARKLEWHPRYFTPQQLADAMRNVAKANASPAARGNAIRHGLFSVLVPVAMRRAGDNLAEFDAHVKRFERALGRGPAEKSLPADEATLIRAAAELVWRHIRAFRRQGEWDRARIAAHLERFDGYSISRVQQAADMAIKLVEILSWGYDALSVPLGKLRRRLERVFRALYMQRFGWDPEFKVFRSRRTWLSEVANNPPEVIGNPGLGAARVLLIQDNELARASRESAGVLGAAASPRAKGKNWAALLQLFRRIFFGTEPPPGSRLERATSRLQEAVAWRLQIFPRQSQWQSQRVREILERAGKSAPLTPRRMYVTVQRILLVFEASDRILDHLPRLDKSVQQALVECLRAAYRRSPVWDHVAILR